jgi:hypothetical protein
MPDPTVTQTPIDAEGETAMPEEAVITEPAVDAGDAEPEDFPPDADELADEQPEPDSRMTPDEPPAS